MEPVSTIAIRMRHADWVAPAGDLDQEFAGDGVTRTFTLTADTVVSLDRVLDNAVDVTSTSTLDAAAKTVTVLAAPAVGETLRVEFQGALAGAHFHDFAGDPDIRGFHCGPFKLNHEWDDRSSDGDSVAQMRPNEFAGYDDVNVTWVTARGDDHPQKFLETAEANPNEPITVQWEYSGGNVDEADFGVGDNGNPFEGKKLVITEAVLKSRGRYVKTRV